jgi:glycosyltransferase involved in cell wall biosynthesis
VAALYKSILTAIEPLNVQIEILFVDDGSKDNTFQIANELANHDKRLRVIKLRKNCGQTPAMVAGIDHARGEILVTMDGDLQNDPADIPKFIEKIKEGYDIVCGWRHKRQDKLISRRIPSVVANWLIGKITGVPIKDNGCSLKAYRSEIIKSIPLYSDMHRFIPAMTSLAGTSVVELKVNHHPRRFGVSKYGITRIYKVMVDLLVIKMLLSFSMRPLRLFAAAGLVSLLAAILLLTVSMTGLVEGELEMNFMVASGALLFGILSFFFVLIGLLGELVLKTGNFPDLFHLKARTE